MSLVFFRNLKFLKCAQHPPPPQGCCNSGLRQMDTDWPAIPFIKKPADAFILTMLIVGNVAGDPPLSGLTIRENHACAHQALMHFDHLMTHCGENDALGP